MFFSGKRRAGGNVFLTNFRHSSKKHLSTMKSKSESLVEGVFISPTLNNNDNMEGSPRSSNSSDCSIASDLFRLPKKSRQHKGKKTLVLDMDETLLHTVVVREEEYAQPPHRGGEQCDMVLRIESGVYLVTLRPYLSEFLEWAAQHFELVVFTAGTEQYVFPVLEKIDPERKYFTHILTRDFCTPVPNNGFGVTCGGAAAAVRDANSRLAKDLSLVNRPLHEVMLVDNSPHCFCFNPDNGIPITSFIDDVEDTALLCLQDFLMKVKDLADVRPALIETFQISSYFTI